MIASITLITQKSSNTLQKYIFLSIFPPFSLFSVASHSLWLYSHRRNNYIRDDAFRHIAITLSRAQQSHQDQTQRHLRQNELTNKHTPRSSPTIQPTRKPSAALATKRNQQNGRRTQEPQSQNDDTTEIPKFTCRLLTPPRRPTKREE
jgi:hypothetical protein